MKILSIDIETYSDKDLSTSGVYAYADSENFRLLLFGYAFDNEKVKIIDIENGQTIPKKIINALMDEKIIKTSFNANFERICISKYLGIPIKKSSWLCTAIQASTLSLPPTLEGVAEVLRVEKGKLKEGKELIKYFSIPSNKKATKEQWQDFKKYCIRDVEVEREIRTALINYPIIEKEQKLYELDQEINDRGILIDRNLVKNAIECDLRSKETLTKRAYEITGLENPNSVSQLKEWLKDRGINADSLDKNTVKSLIKTTNGEVLEILKLRLLMAKTSVKKYEAIERAVCKDGRVHGLLQFYGANRTGRWAGRLVQVQNLPQNKMKDLELARNLLKDKRYEEIEMLYESTPQVLSELIRTTFIPKEGHEFIVADFSAIEARVLAWIAKEEWRIKVFESHGKIYEASASAMFHTPIEEITKGSPLREKGKIAELALGYGGSIGALVAMGALEMGLAEEELHPLVNKWRSTNPKITKFWWDIGNGAIKAVKERRILTVSGIKFDYKGEILFITLPSGRSLSYINPRIIKNRFGGDGLVYEGMGTGRKWTTIDTYGPKLVENIVQGISRDILGEAMLRLRDGGFNIVMHVHDEVVLEIERDSRTLEDVVEIMTTPPEWALKQQLRVEAYKCDYYKKE
ncbi:MAG: DNA polymerase [Clostridium sp.]